ncbi:hypothetical protein RFI_15528, partial [Reticulomyxa filosa]
MGNQLKKEYEDISEQPSATGGLGLRWRLFQAKQKSNQQKVTIFWLDKKSIPKNLRNDRYFELFKQSVDRCYKIKHPYILKNTPNKQQAIFGGSKRDCSKESNGSGGGGGGGGDGTNSNQSSENVDPLIKQHKFGDLEIKLGLSELCEAVLFLHRDAHMIHGFINPCNIYITESGDWKLFGFPFREHISVETEEINIREKYDFIKTNELPYYPSLDCLAPEYIRTKAITAKSDAFSIGRIAYMIHRYKSGIRRDKSITSEDEYRRAVNEWSTHGFHTQGIPNDLVDGLRGLLQIEAGQRTDIKSFCSCKYFADTVLRVLLYLEKLLEKEEASRIAFLKNLPRVYYLFIFFFLKGGGMNFFFLKKKKKNPFKTNVIEQFEPMLLRTKVLPPLLLQMKDSRLVLAVMPSIFKMTEVLSADDFRTVIQPAIQPYLLGEQIPPQLFYYVIVNIDIIVKKVSVDSKRELIVPLI